MSNDVNLLQNHSLTLRDLRPLEVESGRLEVHVTERSSFKSCRLYWDFSYRQQLVSLRETTGPLWFGIGIHYALASYYKNGSLPDDVFGAWYRQQKIRLGYDEMYDDDREKTDKLCALGLSMMYRYPTYAKQNDNWEVIGVEKALRYEVLPGVWLVGSLDLLVRRGGKLWVVDHKTCASFIDPEALEFDDQMVTYLWLVWKVYGEVPGGAIYSMLRKQLPAEPYELKAGGLSKAKSIDTTYDVYLAAIHRLGLNPADYFDILGKVSRNEFYRRETIGRSAKELQIFDETIKREVTEMVRKDVSIYPTMTQDCVWACTYRDLCRTRLTGGDVAFATENNYRVNTESDPRYQEVED